MRTDKITDASLDFIENLEKVTQCFQNCATEEQTVGDFDEMLCIRKVFQHMLREKILLKSIFQWRMHTADLNIFFSRANDDLMIQILLTYCWGDVV